MVNKYWLSIKPCGCLESYHKDDGSILPPGDVNEFVRKAVAKGNTTALQEILFDEVPYRVCNFHYHQQKQLEQKKKEVEMTGLETHDAGEGKRMEITTGDFPNDKELAIEEFTKGGNLSQILATTDKELGGELLSATQTKRRGRKPREPEGLHIETKTIKTVFYHPEPLFRPVADEVFLLNIPGVKIKWPEGKTAQEAVEQWPLGPKS